MAPISPSSLISTDQWQDQEFVAGDLDGMDTSSKTLAKGIVVSTHLKNMMFKSEIFPK